MGVPREVQGGYTGWYTGLYIPRVVYPGYTPLLFTVILTVGLSLLVFKPVSVINLRFETRE